MTTTQMVYYQSAPASRCKVSLANAHLQMIRELILPGREGGQRERVTVRHRDNTGPPLAEYVIRKWERGPVRTINTNRDEA